MIMIMVYNVPCRGEPVGVILDPGQSSRGHANCTTYFLLISNQFQVSEGVEASETMATRDLDVSERARNLACVTC